MWYHRRRQHKEPTPAYNGEAEGFMKIYLTKTIAGFTPSDVPTEDWARTIKMGDMVGADFKKVRNPAFLRKYFALLHLGFDNWVPGEINSEYGVPEKNFEQFREDTTILAGYYHLVIRMNGSVRVVADSISFANMEEEKFEKLYNSTINVFLKHIYNSDMTREKIDQIVNQIMSYT